MDRRLLLLFVAPLLLLSGCAHSSFVEHPITYWFTDAPAGASAADAAAPAAPGEQHCRELARQRMNDAMFQGEDETTQRDVYRRSYRACLEWSARH